MTEQAEWTGVGHRAGLKASRGLRRLSQQRRYCCPWLWLSVLLAGVGCGDAGPAPVGSGSGGTAQVGESGQPAAGTGAGGEKIQAGAGEIPGRQSSTAANGTSGQPASGSEGEESAGVFQFASMRERSGINFLQRSGNSPAKPFPAANGTGCAALDVDMDGQVDLYFANGAEFPLRADAAGPFDRLYRNLGDWRFRDISEVAGIGQAGYSCGLAVGDVDSDGFPDLYITRYGRNLLYRNHGDGTFSESAVAFGVADEHWGTSAAFGDVNHDGLLDLYVCNYGQWTWETSQYCGDESRGIRMFCSPTHVPPEADVLYENAGDGTFRDTSESSGIRGVTGRGQGVLIADVDGDGRTDIYVANDIHPNFLFVGGEQGFQEIGEQSGTAFDHVGQAQAGMGLAIADVDGSGTLDLFVTNYQNEHNALYTNLGQRTFLETGLTAIPEGSLPWVGWGTSFADFDLDGWPDLIVTNGHTDDNLADLGREGQYQQPAGLWKNTGGQFQLVRGAGAYFRQQHVGRGLATADVDNDGDGDVIISHQDAQPELLRNDSCPVEVLGRGIVLRLIGRRANRDAVAAVVTVEFGEQRRMFTVYGGGSYASAADRRLLIGLPGHDDVTLKVRWPDGMETVTQQLPRGERLVIVQDESESSAVRVLRDVQ
jgi:hypothetical protein